MISPDGKLLAQLQAQEGKPRICNQICMSDTLGPHLIPLQEELN